MEKKRQVIEVNGHWHFIEDAYVQVRNAIVGTQTLQDHPDITSYDMADELIHKLMETRILSPKVEAIVQYRNALNELKKFSINESDSEI